MRHSVFSLSLVGITLLATTLVASEPGYVGINKKERTLTRPVLPTDAALAPLGLKKLWYIQIPVANVRDGVATAQIIGSQIVVRTFAGLLVCLDAETGATQWQTYLGKPFPPYVLGVGANEDVLLVMADLRMYGLNRRNGNIEWTYDIPGTPITNPAADRKLMFIGTNEGRVRLLQIPQPIEPSLLLERKEAPAKSIGVVDTSRREAVLEVWSMMLAPPLPQPPIFTDEFILFVDGMNTIGVYDRERKEVIGRFQMRDRPAAPMVAWGDQIYVANRDRSLYALELDKGFLDLRWKFIAGGKYTQRPFPMDNDVFIGTEGPGLFCLDRVNGQVKWQQPMAERFLSASKRLVFAVSPDRKLLVLDRARGLVLATLNAEAYSYAVQNQYSDRFLLVSHDGTLLALRDVSKDSDQPAKYLVAPPKKPPVTAGVKPKMPTPGEEDKKGEEEEKPKKKDTKAKKPDKKDDKKKDEEEMEDKSKEKKDDKKKGEEEMEEKPKDNKKTDPKKDDPKKKDN